MASFYYARHVGLDMGCFTIYKLWRQLGAVPTSIGLCLTSSVALGLGSAVRIGRPPSKHAVFCLPLGGIIRGITVVLNASI